jgi:hypothetical protein
MLKTRKMRQLNYIGNTVSPKYQQKQAKHSQIPSQTPTRTSSRISQQKKNKF